MRRGLQLIVLLCGGDKSTQTKDIAEAMEFVDNWTDEEDKS
jgi:putative addiction module killer protein